MQFKTTAQVFEEPQLMFSWSDVLVTNGNHDNLIPAPGLGRGLVLVYALLQNILNVPTNVRLYTIAPAAPMFVWTLGTQYQGVEWIAVLGREGRLPTNQGVGVWFNGATQLNVNLYYFVEDR